MEKNSNGNNLKQWVEDFTEVLYYRAFYKVSDDELAKDLVQETFLAAAEKISSFEGNSTPKTWLFAILNHKIVDYYRTKNKQPVSTDLQSFPAFFDEHQEWRNEKKPKDWHEEDNHLLDDQEFQEVLKKCLDALPAQWNTCVKLKYIMNKKGEEICQELDITPSNYWQIVHRAKVQLRDCVETKWFQY